VYDFWYSLGAAVMQPDMVPSIEAKNPKFKFVKKTMTVTELDGTTPATNLDGTPVAITITPATGLLEKASTSEVRDVIAAAVGKLPAAPPISIYTASRFCQMLNIKEFNPQTKKNFLTIMADAGSAYAAVLKAAGGVVLSPGFPAFIGMCLLDNALFSLIPAPANANPLKDPLAKFVAEFGINEGSAEWMVMKNLKLQKGFADASEELMLGEDNPWLCGCGDLSLFWPAHSEYTLV
jgi:hypothetical protein